MPVAGVWSQLLLTLSQGVFPDSTNLNSPSLAHQRPELRPTHELSSQGDKRKLNGRFLHITDFHPDDFYQPRTSTQEGIACHRGNGMAGTYGASRTDCDSPFSLVNATFAWIEENLKDDIDFIVWTGDSARHDSDEKHPRNTAEVLRTNQELADKFVDTFSSEEGHLNIPIIPSLGNNDFLPHNIFLPGPNHWLHSYGEVWRPFIPETQRHSFEFGGWFYVEVVPDHLAVFSLNTMYFFDRNAGVDGCADPDEPGYHHMEWLRVQLQLLRERGMKAILTGHVPPAKTENKWNWDDTCWQKYTLWLKQYRDVVTGSLFGHMNIDHFILSDSRGIEIDEEMEEAELSSQEDDISSSTSAVAERKMTKRTLRSRHVQEEFSSLSKSDYLQELRSSWGDLPGDLIKSLDAGAQEVDEEEVEIDEEDSIFTRSKKGRGDKKKKKKKKGKKKDKYKKLGGKYAERYQLSLISPSVVPNYFPSLRVFEYNITGLEYAPTWKDVFSEEQTDQEEPERLELRDVQVLKKEKSEGKKGKHPKFKVPEGPSKNEGPGPAYLAQPLTLTGYVQYFANLTYLNNDISGASLSSSDTRLDSLRWRKGKHDDETPKFEEPRPRDFQFNVEYSTFDDKIYGLDDLTLKNMIKLAYRMGKNGKAKGLGNDYDDDDDTEEEEEEGNGEDGDAGEQGKKKRKKKKKKKKKQNKVWKTFLSRAFVGSVPDEELED